MIKIKCRDLNKIDLPFTQLNPIKKNLKLKEVVGFDTETQKGKCYLLGYTDKNKSDILFSDNPETIFDYLLQKQFRDTYNFFYNINYDFQAIIKTLPIQNLKELKDYNKTTYKDYKLDFLQNKSFSISKNEHRVKFFDLLQFFNFNSLNNSAIKFLNMSKLDLKEDNIDIKNLNFNKYQYDLNYRITLNKYLNRDTEITYKLGVKLIEMVKPYVNPKSFYSQASISEQYFLENLDTKMNLPPKNILQFALNAYQGGRFEVFKKGSFDNSYIYDIKSAYPFHNIKVPNLSTGKWIKEKEYNEDSLISLFKINTDIHDINISPLKYQLKSNLMIYPIGKFKDVYVNKQELNLLNELGYKSKIIEGFSYYDKEPEYPYTFLKDFYDLKEKYKHEDKKELSWIPKIIINGFYGKTIQVNPNYRYTSIYEGDTDLYDVYENEGKLIYCYKQYKAGKLFNPVVANEITANTRIQLFNSAIKQESNIIGFQTDSIISDKRLNGLNMNDKLGDWELETEGKMLILGSGVYQLLGDKPKMKLRGFSKNLDLNNLLNENKTRNDILINLTRNHKLKNTFKLKLDDKRKYELFNLIENETKTININFDKKRIWDSEFKNCDSVLTQQIESKPIII